MVTQLASLPMDRLDEIFGTNTFFNFGSSRDATEQILTDVREMRSLFAFETEARLRKEYNDLNRTIMTQKHGESYESFINRCEELNYRIQQKDAEIETAMTRRTLQSQRTSGNFEEDAPVSPDYTMAARRAAVLFQIAKTVP